MEPISDSTSKNFINNELIKRSNLNVYSSEYIKYLCSDRNIVGYVNNMYNHVLKSTVFPVFILLNIKFDSADSKHAEVIVVTQNKDTYTVGLFDSNGLLGTKLEPDKNVRRILNLLSEKLDTEPFEYNRTNINTAGKGNCDAICLWFIYINQNNTSKTKIQETVNKLVKNMTSKEHNIKDITYEINNSITILSKKP